MEESDTLEQLPAQARETVPDRVSMPRVGNDRKEDDARPSSVVSAVAGDGGAPRGISPVVACIHQALDYLEEEVNRASYFINNLLEPNRGEVGEWRHRTDLGGNDGGGSSSGSGSSSIFDETGERYLARSGAGRRACWDTDLLVVASRC